MEDFKRTFIENEFKMFSWSASVQHNSIYANDVNRNKRIEFRHEIEKFIDECMISKYKKAITEEEHIHNLEEIKNFAENKFSLILKNKKHKIGTIQKHLNLLLKYYWCNGWIKMPVHCPIDRIILNEAGINDVSWTKLEKIGEYEETIMRLRNVIKEKNLAEWELRIWQRRSNS